MEQVTFYNGVKMPIVGYGVYQVSKEECERCVLDALAVGYRSIDTAQSYFNEEQVGNAIVKSGVPRKDIFLTTKVWIEHYGYEEAKKAVLESMRKLQTEYLDLVLLHQPFSDYYGAYRALEDLYGEGKLRAIGVSNFYADRLADLCANFETAPAVNQIECHPFYQRQYDIEVMNKLGVAVMAWAPLAEGGHDIWNNMTLKSIADKHHKTVAQVALRFSIQRNVIVIPKTVHPNRMLENMSIWDFELDETDMEKLKTLDTGKTKIIDHLNVETVRFLNKHKVHD